MATTSAPVDPTAVPRPLARKKFQPAEMAFEWALRLSVALALGALVWLFVSVLTEGASALTWDFLTSKASSRAARAGFKNALYGSLVLMMITTIVAVPLGFAAATYLEKFAPMSKAELRVIAMRRERALAHRRAKGLSGPGLLLGRVGVLVSKVWATIGPPINRIVEINISNLAAVPSIIYGLLGLALFVSIMGISKSLLAGGLTLAILVLPIIIIASREAIRAVPSSIEQGAMALGATKWQAVRSQVLPAALPGMLTGTILATSRAIGETAPLIVVGGVAFGTAVPSLNPLKSGDEPLFAMPLQIFDWVERPQQALWGPLSAAGILVLIGTLVVMNLVAIVLRNRFSRSW